MNLVQLGPQTKKPGGPWQFLPAVTHRKATSLSRSSLYPSDPKPCANCGTIFARREGESAVDFAKRKGCSPECRSALIRRGLGKEFPPKPCVVCGVLFGRRPGEAAPGYRGRMTCSTRCRYALVSQKKQKHPEPKRCAVCNRAMVYDRAKDTVQEFEKRLTCSSACRRIAQSRTRKATPERGPRPRTDAGTKPCVICGVLFDRRDTERLGEFRRRQTCDHACAVEYVARRNRRHGRMGPAQARRHWFPADWTDDLKLAIRMRDGFVCRLCFAPENGRAHHVHHVDYVRANTHPANLITLCPACHGKTNFDRPHWRAVLAALMQEDP